VIYKIEQGNDELSSAGGLPLIGKLLNGLKNLKATDNMQFGKTKKGNVSHSGILKSMAALLSLGKTDFANIKLYRNDKVFKESLDLKKVPSQERLRQRLDEMGDKACVPVGASNIELLKKVEDFGKEKTSVCEYTPCDFDVSPFDNSGSHKEGVSLTYKKKDGFAPMLGYVGNFGYMLDCEFREGSQHSNKGAYEFFSSCLDGIEKLGLENPLIRLDSAHDDAKIIKLFQDRGARFLIKRNLRKESQEQWLALAKRVGKCKSPRDGKKVYTGIASHIKVAGRKDLGPVFAVFEVIERTMDKDGQILLIPNLEVNTWWTNLPEEADEIIQLYHNHGTSEQYHSELKSDIGLERMPSDKFSTNALILKLAMLAFNALRIIGQSSMELKELLPVKFNVARRRLKTVIQDLIYIACKRVTHGGYELLKFGRNCPWFGVYRQLYLNFS